MSKKTLLFGAIASIIAINSVIADTVVTSRNYVDTRDALKQDKITAGTTGNVVLYNGTQNGQTQFSERAIYDGTNEYDSSTDANKLITAGAVDGMVGDVYDYVDDEISNIPAPELPTGEPNYAVLYDSNGNIGGETPIDYYGSAWFDSEGGAMINGHDEDLITAKALRENLIYDISTQHDDHADGAIITGQALIRYAQPLKTCAGWADGTTTPDATHTNANCVLWNFPEGEYFWESVGRD